MSTLDKFLRKTCLADPKTEPKPTWKPEVIRGRLDKLKAEVIQSQRVHPVLEFFDSLNIHVYNSYRVNVNASGEIAEANRHATIEIWDKEYDAWYKDFHQSLLSNESGF